MPKTPAVRQFKVIVVDEAGNCQTVVERLTGTKDDDCFDQTTDAELTDDDVGKWYSMDDLFSDVYAVMTQMAKKKR